jgi:hypothetical protein
MFDEISQRPRVFFAHAQLIVEFFVSLVPFGINRELHTKRSASGSDLTDERCMFAAHTQTSRTYHTICIHEPSKVVFEGCWTRFKDPSRNSKSLWLIYAVNNPQSLKEAEHTS